MFPPTIGSIILEIFEDADDNRDDRRAYDQSRVPSEECERDQWDLASLRQLLKNSFRHVREFISVEAGKKKCCKRQSLNTGEVNSASSIGDDKNFHTGAPREILFAHYRETLYY